MRRYALLLIGMVLLACGVAVGTRPLELDDPPGFDCGSVLAPGCDTLGEHTARVAVTGALLLGGVALVGAACAQWVTNHRGDRWSTGDALLLVAAPILVLGAMAAALSYVVILQRWFPDG